MGLTHVNKLLIMIGLLCIVVTSILLVYAAVSVGRITIDVIDNENDLRNDDLWKLNGLSNMAFGITPGGEEYLCME